MSDEMRTILVQGLQFLLRKESAVRKDSKQSLRTMPLALNISSRVQDPEMSAD